MNSHTASTALIPAAKVPEGQTPPMIAADQASLLLSDDPTIAANKRLCYDMYRTVLQAGRADKVRDYIGPHYIQHNPNVISGVEALETFIRNSRPERPIAPTIELPLIAIVAERDMVQFTFVRSEQDENGQTYYTSWFDLFRIENGKIVEHWDPALKSPDMLKLDPNKKRIPQ
ncbi:MAG: hypothetical protein E2598_12510 [Sphingobium sp.]|nr:hypothetical protein [Sphingobium sp.]